VLLFLCECPYGGLCVCVKVGVDGAVYLCVFVLS